MKSRVIEDRACGIVIEITDGGLARVAWRDGTSNAASPNKSCWVDVRQLEIGRWIPMRLDGTEDEPTIYVVCRATALVVGAAIKVDVLEALEGLP